MIPHHAGSMHHYATYQTGSTIMLDSAGIGGMQSISTREENICQHHSA